MPLVKNNSMSSVHLRDSSKLNILKHGVEEKTEVGKGCLTSIYVVGCCDGVEIWTVSGQFQGPITLRF